MSDPAATDQGRLDELFVAIAEVLTSLATSSSEMQRAMIGLIERDDAEAARRLAEAHKATQLVPEQMKAVIAAIKALIETTNARRP
jgi:hypothetical protein